MIVYKCDKCGITAEERSKDKSPEGWEDIQIGLGNHSMNVQNYDLCAECLVKLGLDVNVATDKEVLFDTFLSLVVKMMRIATIKTYGQQKNQR